VSLEIEWWGEAEEARGPEIEFPRLSKYLKNYVSRGYTIGLKLIGQYSSLSL
jgi:hypothetical protein